MKKYKQNIDNYIIFLIFNGLVSFYLLLLLKFITDSFSLVSIINWIDLNTKKFILTYFIIFALLLFTAKIQIKWIRQLNNQNGWIIYLLKTFIILGISFIFALVTSIYLQYAQSLHNLPETILWISDNPAIYYIGLLLLLSLFIFTFSLIGNVYLSSFLTASILFLIGFAHYNKLNLRIEPLYPSDFMQIGQLKEVIPMVMNSFSVKDFIFILVIISVIIVLTFLLPKIRISLWTRGVLILFSVIVIYSFANFPNTFLNIFFDKAGVIVSKWNPLNTYDHNGFVIGFLANSSNKKLPIPEGYTKEKVLEIAQKYANNKINNSPNELPNIIYIMNESFWDPTRLENDKIKFSEDPLKNVRSLSKNYTSGYIYSPAFGGATANIEFEALTGFSTSFLNPGSIAYQEIVYRKNFIPSIVSDLERKGYESLAIHPYNRAFYKRSIVYNTFGFNEFRDMNTMKYQEKSGPMISDKSVSKEIIDHIRNTKDPSFIHAVTMQNHMPYNSGRYEENTIKVTGLPEEASSPLEVYSEGVKQADLALKYLIDELDELEEPTIIVFWGDHLPILGPYRSVYSDANFAQTNNDLLNDKLFSETPLLIYSNYNINKVELNTISPSYLAKIVYDLTGLEKPTFFNLLDELFKEIPGIKTNAKIGANQEFIKTLSPKQKELLNDYRLLQYDLLAGKQYTLDILYSN
ncbi:LTA synthase family protein [Niallia sp. Krafla_26]|uniref:LTA synthase family protein n=1 Tax=Niallia sp. Krafla_26 TaxID=3064703 RepID=UPI003D16D784